MSAISGDQLQLTPRDRAILETLTFKVEVISVPQLAQSWWAESASGEDHARQRLDALETAGFVCGYSVHARALLPLSEPVFTWTPGDADPNPYAIAERLQRRWDDEGPPQLTRVYVATQQTANRFGQSASFAGELKQPGQVTHDLHMTAIYLRMMRSYPDLAKGWVGEASRKADLEMFEKLPDAILVDGQGQARLAIEFGGKYDHRRVAAFHEHCADRKLAYELW